MNAFAIGLLSIGVLTSAHAQKTPSYKEAREIYEQLGKPVAATGLWDKKPLSERLAAVKAADQLIARVEKLDGKGFGGPLSACKRAATAMKFYVMDLNDLALVWEGRSQVRNANTLFSPSFNAVNFGEMKAACYEEVEALDTVAPVAKR